MLAVARTRQLKDSFGQESSSVAGHQGCCPRVSSRCWTGEMAGSSSNHKLFWPFPITSQEHLKQFGIWEGQSSRKWLEFVNGAGEADLHSNWKPFPLLGFVFQAKEQIRWGGLQTTWMNKNLTCNAKNKQETFLPHSGKKLKKEKHVSEATGYKQKSKTNWELAWAEPCKGNSGGITVTMHRSSKRGRERQLPIQWSLRGYLGKNKQERILKQILCLLFQER